MAVLARRVSHAKWEATLGNDRITADAVTADLRTTNNSLSFWRCDASSDDGWHRAVLAVAAAADRPDRLDIVCLDEEDVRTLGLSTTNTPGTTPVASLRGHHVDIVQLDLGGLSDLAQLVATARRSKPEEHRMSRRRVVELVARAVSDGLVCVADLKDGMKSAVTERLGQ